MEFVIKMLRLKLRNERIYRSLASEYLSYGDSISKDERISFEESKKNAEQIIPQLEKAIKILVEWKDK